MKVSNNKQKPLSLKSDTNKFYRSFSFVDDIGNRLSLQSIDTNLVRFKYNKFRTIKVKASSYQEKKVDSFFRLNPYMRKMINLKNFLSRLYKMPYENISYFRNNGNVFRDARQIVRDYIENGFGGICVDFVLVTGHFLDILDIKWFPLKSDIDDRKDCHIAIKALIDDRWYFIDPGLYLSPISIENRTQNINSGRYGITIATYNNQNNSIRLLELNNKKEVSFSVLCNLNNIISLNSLYKLFDSYKKLPIMKDLHLTRKTSNGNLIEFHHGRFRKYNKNGKLLETIRIPAKYYSEFIAQLFNIEKYIVEKAKQLQEIAKNYIF